MTIDCIATIDRPSSSIGELRKEIFTDEAGFCDQSWMTLPVHMHVGGAEPMVQKLRTDLVVDDLALAGPGIESAAFSYHSRVGFRKSVDLSHDTRRILG